MTTGRQNGSGKEKEPFPNNSWPVPSRLSARNKLQRGSSCLHRLARTDKLPPDGHGRRQVCWPAKLPGLYPVPSAAWTREPDGLLRAAEMNTARMHRGRSERPRERSGCTGRNAARVMACVLRFANYLREGPKLGDILYLTEENSTGNRGFVRKEPGMKRTPPWHRAAGILTLVLFFSPICPAQQKIPD